MFIKKKSKGCFLKVGEGTHVEATWEPSCGWRRSLLSDSPQLTMVTGQRPAARPLRGGAPGRGAGGGGGEGQARHSVWAPKGRQGPAHNSYAFPTVSARLRCVWSSAPHAVRRLSSPGTGPPLTATAVLRVLVPTGRPPRVRSHGAAGGAPPLLPGWRSGVRRVAESPPGRARRGTPRGPPRDTARPGFPRSRAGRSGRRLS